MGEEEPQNSTQYGSEIPLEMRLADLHLRIGKTFSELNKEFEAILDCIRQAKRDFMGSTSCDFDPGRDDRVFNVINQWKSFVYEEICKKTGEIKNIITYSTNGKSLRISHEIEGWKDITLLKGFCDYVDIKIDESFYKICKVKLNDICCLTIIVWIEVTEGPAGSNMSVGCNILKPSDRHTLLKFLEGSVEKSNILTWFDSNGPVPLDFGMSVGELDSEIIIGFYFFDGSPQVNLSKALTGLQAYGADINSDNINLFKEIPGEEIKVYFAINKYGAQRVSLQMFKLSEKLLHNMLETLDKKYDQAVWEQYKNLFSGMTLKTYYTLEYDNDGFKIFCTREVGAEVGSKVYLDDF